MESSDHNTYLVKDGSKVYTFIFDRKHRLQDGSIIDTLDSLKAKTIIPIKLYYTSPALSDEVFTDSISVATVKLEEEHAK